MGQLGNYHVGLTGVMYVLTKSNLCGIFIPQRFCNLKDYKK